jgi:hypothetical protein
MTDFRLLTRTEHEHLADLVFQELRKSIHEDTKRMWLSIADKIDGQVVAEGYSNADGRADEEPEIDPTP